MRRLRRRLAGWSALVVSLQLAAVAATAAACCQSGCEMDHGVTAAAECHGDDAEVSTGGHCPMSHAAPATDAAPSLSCDCDQSRAIDLLLGATALLGTAVSVETDVRIGEPSWLRHRTPYDAPHRPFAPPPRA